MEKKTYEWIMEGCIRNRKGIIIEMGRVYRNTGKSKRINLEDEVINKEKDMRGRQ